MRSLRGGPAIGLVAQVGLLAALAGTVGLGDAGWVVGLACGVVTNLGLARGLARSGADRPGPADQVTLVRATLVGGVAALVADSSSQPAPVPTLVALTAVALVLDAVDGWVARRTRTVSALGARFDTEVDAFLILVLSGYVARGAGGWVLALGLARYAFVAAGWLLPWLRGSLPPRYWRKVVAASVGIVLAVAAADVLPRSWTDAALAAALVMLAWSFGTETWSLWRGRTIEPGRARWRAIAAVVATVGACLLVWFALVAPNELGRLTLTGFLRLPLEALLFVVVVLVLPPWPRRVVAMLAGVMLGLLAVVKLLDMGFRQALGRPFDPVIDWRYLGSAVSLLGDSIGRSAAIVALVTAGVLALGVLVLMPLAVLRLTRIVDGHRATSLRAVTALGVVWVLCAGSGVQLVKGAPIASTSAADLTYDRVSRIPGEIRDQREFAKSATEDPLRDTPAARLLTGLRGKDVIVAFVESYGRVAVQGSSFSPGVTAVLDDGTRRLQAVGFDSRSAFLTSPTFGAISWLAHATLQSGLWVDSQQRYDVIVGSDRFTLSEAFKRAGWRTVGDVPANDHDWPEGTSFYHYDQLYDARNVGYAGPKFSYASMPDQYTLAAFQRLELAKRDRPALMAEIDLISSHAPWTPLPHLIDWDEVGDGSVYDDMPAQGQQPDVVWRDPEKVRAVYGQSIEYSLGALISFVETYGNDDLVLVVLGDHQPATIVSGDDAGHDVPVTVIAHDPAVLARISGWGWQDGLRPHPDAPVWPMDAFRDRFLTAYGPGG